MPALLCGIILILLLSGAAIAYFVWRIVVRHLDERKTRQRLLLLNYLSRLKVIVDCLLQKVDSLDQESKYSGVALTKEQSNQMAEACCHLVALGDAVSTMELSLHEDKLSTVRSKLLLSLEQAGKVSHDLRLIQPLSSSTTEIKPKNLRQTELEDSL